MKVTIEQLQYLIKEIVVKSVDDYQPQAAWDDTSPRVEESPKKKDRIGNFFMTKLKTVPLRYGGLKKNRYFYMVLPDGEAISIGSIPDIIDSEGRIYLKMLDDNVVPLDISDYRNMSQQDMKNFKSMQDAVLSVKNAYIRKQKVQQATEKVLDNNEGTMRRLQERKSRHFIKSVLF